MSLGGHLQVDAVDVVGNRQGVIRVGGDDVGEVQALLAVEEAQHCSGGVGEGDEAGGRAASHITAVRSSAKCIGSRKDGINIPQLPGHCCG